MVILSVEDVSRHAPVDWVLSHVAKMLLVQRNALDALQIDDGGDEIRYRNTPARQRAHRVECPDAVGNDADAPAPALRQAVEIFRKLALRLPRRLRLVIEADHLAARKQRPEVLRLIRSVRTLDVDDTLMKRKRGIDENLYSLAHVNICGHFSFHKKEYGLV